MRFPARAAFCQTSWRNTHLSLPFPHIRLKILWSSDSFQNIFRYIPVLLFYWCLNPDLSQRSWFHKRSQSWLPLHFFSVNPLLPQMGYGIPAMRSCGGYPVPPDMPVSAFHLLTYGLRYEVRSGNNRHRQRHIRLLVKIPYGSSVLIPFGSECSVSSDLYCSIFRLLWRSAGNSYESFRPLL